MTATSCNFCFSLQLFFHPAPPPAPLPAPPSAPPPAPSPIPPPVSPHHITTLHYMLQHQYRVRCVLSVSSQVLIDRLTGIDK